MKYICIWPDDEDELAWPVNLPREETKECMERLFMLCGYQITSNPDFDQSLDKIAIYCKGAIATHVARQLEKGRWTSKLGGQADLSHTLEALEDGDYGKVTSIMQRPKSALIEYPKFHPIKKILI